jgi:hypothetical protein
MQHDEAADPGNTRKHPHSSRSATAAP